MKTSENKTPTDFEKALPQMREMQKSGHLIMFNVEPDGKVSRQKLDTDDKETS